MSPQTAELGLRESFVRLFGCVMFGGVLWFIPAPEGVTSNAWHLASVFAAVIISFIVRPYPMGTMVILGLVILVLTKTLTMKEALSGFADTTVWLVVSAFFLAGTVVGTGLGRRIALTLVHVFGKSILGLAYSLCGAELVLGPFIPSNTVRGGGIVAPIARALAESLDSRPGSNSTVGQYLVLVGAQANLITASMFLTAMAANGLISIAAKEHLDIDFDWPTWAWGAIVPGLVALTLLPWLMYWLAPPPSQSTRAAQREARDGLQKMGPWSGAEIAVALVMLLLLCLWATSKLHGLSTTLVSWIGVIILLLFRIQSWDDIVGNKGAWDAFAWLGGLLTMANFLKEFGFVDWLAQQAGGLVTGLPGLAVILVLAVMYYYSMYSFSMLTAHISAMVGAFLIVSETAGAPAMLSVALLAYFSNLCASTTNYSTGPVVIYFGLRYVPASTWFRCGFVVSLFHLAIWYTVGLAWWKLIGWW